MSDTDTPEGYPPNPGLPQLPARAAQPAAPAAAPSPQPQSAPPPVQPPPAAAPPAAAPPAAAPAVDAAARSHRSPDLPPPEPPRAAPAPAAQAAQEDAAARFRRPGEAPAPAAAPADAPLSGEAPGVGELFERSLTALLLGRSAFEPLAQRPSPSYGAMTLLAAGFAVAGLGLNAVLAAVSQPALLGRYPGWFYAAVSAGAVGISLACLLLSAAVLFGLGKALGGKGGFERGYLAAAMLFALAPIQSMASLAPYAWIAPSLLFAWAGAGALAGLLGANFTGALAACAMLAGLSIAGQGVARAAFAKSQEVLAQSQALLQAGQAAQSAGAMLQTLQQMQAPVPGAGAPAPVLGELAGEPEGQAPAPALGGSSLDLLRGDGDAPPGAAPSAAQQQLLHEQSDVLRRQAVAMLESVMPMLDNPAVTKNLDAQGKADAAELRSMLVRLKDQTAQNTKVSDAEFAASMQKIQNVTLRLMGAGMGALPQAGKSAPPRGPGAGETTR